MSDNEFERLLRDCVLDTALVGRLRKSVEEVAGHYGVDLGKLEQLLGSDEMLLEYLGKGVRREVAAAGTSSPGACTAPPVRRAEALAASTLVLRLVPYVQRNASEGDPPVIVNYVGHLDPLPPGSGVEDLPDVPAAGLPGQPLAPLPLVVEIRPVVANDDAGNQTVSFQVRALPFVTPEPGKSRPAPWRHDTGSPAVQAAAAAARAAAPGERHARLLALVDAMTGTLPSGTGG